MPVPPPRSILLLVLVLALALGSSCGVADQDRPRALVTYPAAAETVAGPLDSIRVGFDEPITVLNKDDVRVFVDGLFLPTVVGQPDDDPTGLWIYPVGGPYYPAPAHVRVELAQGAVVNSRSHYADAVFVLEFYTAP